MKTLIAFFYLLNGNLVSYTVSEYGAFQKEEHVEASLTCQQLADRVGHDEKVRQGLHEGESMRAECYRTDDMMKLGDPTYTVTVTRK
ncbi:MAG: hypothetical protein GC201_09105 [Alphaproteobacteria bacterium]|nr:hypothetical protein [Alphaproteobacteria bacterium]